MERSDLKNPKKDIEAKNASARASGLNAFRTIAAGGKHPGFSAPASAGA
jgi:hypothetical protein